MAKKTIKEMLKPASITISFTREEVDWLAWVVKDVMGAGMDKQDAKALLEYASPEMLSACDKIIDAEELLQNVDKVLNEGTKVRKVDARKRPASRSRRKGARR